jgi:hypothetical protein
MMPTFSERQELAKQFADHVTRMRGCLQAAGRHASDDDIVRAWAQYSEDLCAGWLMLPDDDPALLEILLRHLPSSTDTRTNLWRTTIVEASDGSGDGIMQLPDELLMQIGWKEGDTLSIIEDESGDLIIRRVE